MDDYSDYDDWKDGKLPKVRCKFCRELFQVGGPCDCEDEREGNYQ